jgi:hypothetical protein
VFWARSGENVPNLKRSCGTWVTTLAGIKRARVASVRAELRELAQQHANEVGREIKVTLI